MKVPFLDLAAQNEPLKEALFDAIRDAINDTDFVLGPRLRSFEAEFAAYCGCSHAVGVNSGTGALFLALRALGVGPGHEVITAPNVFIAAVEAIARTGATPVLADVSEATYCLDPEKVAAAITKRTRAIIPIHLFGQLCDIDALLDVAAAHDVPVIEDACQAHGALYKGGRAGSLGKAAAFSFYPTKNLSAFGDGGAVTTSDGELARRIASLRHHAQSEKNTHDELGYNSRLDSLQAAVLSVKLAHLDGWNERRRALAERIKSGVGDRFRFQSVLPDTTPVYHILAARHAKRDAVHAALDEAGIGWGKHIAMPIHFQPGYRYLGYEEGSLPVSEALCNELVSLPICPTLSDDQADYVAETLRKIEVSVV